MKINRIIALVIAAIMLFALVVACGDDGPATTAPATGEGGVTVPGAPAEGPDTNNGRPFNLSPIAWDSRDTSKYLNGINATVLPIVPNKGDVTIDIWWPFSSTVITSKNESEVFIEAIERTNVVSNFIHPPTGADQDNFMLRIAADDLPHVFALYPHGWFPGGLARAVEEGVFLDLTPYYDQGMMPNIQWLRNSHPRLAEEINRDFMDDAGRMLAFIMIDIVPSHPWSGPWFRQDWLDKFNFSVPETIEEWNTVLYAWRDEVNRPVLFVNLDMWFGEQTNYMVTGAYDSGFRQFLNMDGTAGFGSVQPGYKAYLEQMHQWYVDGILDPDFGTRSYDDYIANVINGNFLAFGMAYGDVGPLNMGGRLQDPNFKMVPAVTPSSRAGQITKLGQNNSHVRSARSVVTDRAEDDGIVETVIRWMDYWYSQDGGDLSSYGIEGHAYYWGDDGNFHFIHPMLQTPDADFWSVFDVFKNHEWSYLRDSTAYEMEPEVWECIDLWGAQDLSWVFPDNIAFTPDEASEIARIMTDIDTHTLEQTLAFITGTRPISEFDTFVSELESMGLANAVSIRQAALTRYLSR